LFFLKHVSSSAILQEERAAVFTDYEVTVRAWCKETMVSQARLLERQHLYWLLRMR
jgi:hypothetical protein